MVTIEQLKEILNEQAFVYLVKDSSDIYWVNSPAQVQRRVNLNPDVESIKLTAADIGERTLEELFVSDVEKSVNETAAKKSSTRKTTKK